MYRFIAKRLLSVLGTALLFVAGTLLAMAQDGVATRDITSDDFAAKRPVSKATGPATSSRRTKKVRYRKRAGRKKPVRKNDVWSSNKKKKDPVSTDLGVTLWRLRPSKKGEEAAFLPVKVGNNSEMWAAERVGLDTVFRPGDKLRFAVESSIEGYLYVINSEVHADGTYGAPYLIFPEGGGSNRVAPGILVDIPDKKDDFPYFNITPRNRDYAGEMITAVISPVPLNELKTDADGKIVSLGFLIQMETDSDTEEFDRLDNDDSVFTIVESAASCGARSRSTVVSGSPSANPCGPASRQLTREEPLPQTILRVNASKGGPAAATLILKVEP